ncbi:hypothetical protein MKEN_00209100 [Mycena kentingensis (nom. inval.)]|nr:hypothetical protein MKEN_00209100 [Mycena kentingensis (nom. inval.)]
MPKRRRNVLASIANLTRRAIVSLSPKKKRQKTHESDEVPTDSQSIASLGPVHETASNGSGFFHAPPAVDSALPAASTGWFYHTGPRVDPEMNTTGSTHVWQLPPPPNPRTGCATGSDADDISMISEESADSDSEDDPTQPLRDAMANEQPEASETPLPNGKLREAPSVVAATAALRDLKNIISPPRANKTGKPGGHTDPGFDPFRRHRLESMKIMLNLYTASSSLTRGRWVASSLQAAIAQSAGVYFSRQIRILVRAFIADRTELPINPYGYWKTSMLVDEELMAAINLFLQELGKNITAYKLRDFLQRPEVMERHGITRKVSLSTAERYLKTLGYRWMAPKKGQYADGHERADVVEYRQTKFLPAWAALQARMDAWSADNVLEEGPRPQGKPVVAWFHDESIFYAHDRRRKTWYHKDAPAKPYAKGDGASCMVADYVSAKYGWLRSRDGQEDARVVMFPGKNKDGYFTNTEILEQVAHKAMTILNRDYPDEQHIFIYDNATTHLKRPEGSLSATKMTKGPSAKFFVEVNDRNPDGSQIYTTDGKFKKKKIQMTGANFNGAPQDLYYPSGHALAGQFKGMDEILHERGINFAGKLAQCKGFKCAPPALDCCCRRILYNQPDFEQVKSTLKTECEGRGFTVLFLPKFHCEINFIEQCWGYAKRLYRLNPESSREDALERNTIAAIDAVPLDSMRRFANRAMRFMDAYMKGLTGSQAAWAARKYRGHRTLPPDMIMDNVLVTGTQ